MELSKSLSLDSRTVDEVCELARDSSAAPELEEYLGDDQYQQLREVVQGDSRSTARGAPGTIILLHGIMGSQIGKALRGEWDIVWMNPLAVRDGNFSLLKLGSGTSRYGARGLLPMFYALLWARLKYWYRYNIVEFAYDWRVGIRESGDKLVKFIDQKTTGPVYIVAHSMGGLVARAALPTMSNRVERIVQLASPNYGSFSPVVTMRGQNEFVNKILAFDGSTTVTKLISETVSTFQGLYEMIPAPSRFSTFNLFDSGLWPASPTINTAALLQAKSAIEQLPGPDKRFVLIAGNNQETVTGMTVDPSGEFRFTTTTAGDGTVPLDFARFDAAAQVPTYLADVTHNGIIADGPVSAAVDDIIRTGATTRFPRDTGAQRSVSGGRPLDLKRALDPLGGRSASSIPPAEVRAIQREVLGPLKSNVTLAVPPVGLLQAGPLPTGPLAPIGDGGDQGIQAQFKSVVVSRRRRRVRFALAKGDITQVPAHAHVLGVFEGVKPSGPALAFDKLLGGALSDLTERQMFSGARGKVFFLPTYKTAVPGDLLTIAGLGSFADFKPEVVADVTQQVVKSLLSVRVNELATVIFGGSFGDVKKSLEAALKGLIKGLDEFDRNYEFQRIIICENDDQKFAAMQEELYRLASSPIFDGTDVEFDVLPVEERIAPRGVSQLAVEQAIYVISHLSEEANNTIPTYRHEVSVLSPGTSILPRTIFFPKEKLDLLIRLVQQGAPGNVDDFGKKLADLVLPPEVISEFKDVIGERGMQLLHDPLSTRIPWEAVKFDDVWPALARGLCRKYQGGGQPVAMFSQSQQQSRRLRILLVYNPTEDLGGAEKEGERIRKVAGKWSGQMEVAPLHGPEATHEAILAELQKANYDILHYAGHAAFDADNPDQSGLRCSGGKILSGRNLTALGAQLPPVIVLNACQSGRVRNLVPTQVGSTPNPTEPESSAASVAGAILKTGIKCFVATYWPVSDAGADIFADKFYDSILQGCQTGKQTSVGDAMLSARQELKAKGENDWANYMLYGDPGFLVKRN